MRTTYLRAQLVTALPLPFGPFFRVRKRLVPATGKSTSVSTSKFGRFEGVLGISGMFIMTSKSPSTVAWENDVTEEEEATGEDFGSWREGLRGISANEQRM